MAYLGIDIGTSACKALVLDKDGTVLASSTSDYGLDQPKPGWTEQDPEVWIEGAKHAIAGALSQISNTSTPEQSMWLLWIRWQHSPRRPKLREIWGTTTLVYKRD